MSASGIRAGRAFVEIGVNDTITRGLQAVQKRLATFGKSVGVAGIAAGNLMARGIEMGLKQVGKVAQAAYEAAKLDPRTAAETGRFEESLDGLWKALSTVGASIVSIVLPGLRLMVDGLTSITQWVQDGITWLEQYGATAALQTGDIGSAFAILWADTQILFLQGSQAILGVWDGMIAGMLNAWDSMAASLLEVLGSALSQAGDSIRGAMTGLSVAFPQFAAQLQPLKEIGKALQDIGNGVDTAGNVAAESAIKNAAMRAEQSQVGQDILQQQIEQLRKERDGLERQAVQARDMQRSSDIAAFKGPEMQKMANVGTFSSVAAGLIGSQNNTAKQQLTVARETKALAEKQTKALEKIAANLNIPAFT